jgi:formylmethanofuran dehydrogenase subunit E
MITMTGKIVMIESKEIVKSETDRFMKVTLVLVKQMKGVKRNVCFESYGKVAKEILNFRNGDRLRVYFTIDSVLKNGNWYHTLKVSEVEKEIKTQKKENINQNTINYDTIKKSFG